MAVKIQTAQGAIEIENDVIATIVGGATTDNYGVVGMASQNPLRDGVNQILNGDNFSKGVVVRQQDGGVTVDVHIIVGYGMKISEISKSVQSRVKNDLNVMLGIVASEVNVTVQGVRMLGDQPGYKELNTVEVVTTITNDEFGKMINAAADALKNNAEKINKLNVFPVPDGDTGTNMTLSMASGAEYERNENDTHLGKLAQATAKGLLMGARGNSGVILSQIFRGFAAKIADKETLSARDLADALMGGAETAYKAVMKPTEGTILTVIREAASAANQTAKKTDDATQVLGDALEAAEKALASTPELLPVLKEVGVVDSGGQE